MSAPASTAAATHAPIELNGRYTENREEVWEGVPFMPPLANNEHQKIGTKLGTAIDLATDQRPDVDIYVGVNVSDREDEWLYNYRIPDVAVVLPGGKARDCQSHLCGGPDFATEVGSSGDRSRDKLGFYEKIGVRELLIVDRDPWALELYRLQGSKLLSVGRVTVESGGRLTSTVLPLSFGLIAGTARPQIEVGHQDGVRRWVI